MQQGNTLLKLAPEPGHTLVVIFLRGGADGLTMVVPREDDAYYRARPSIAVAAADTLALDDHFGLHKALEPLQRSFAEGELLLVHGAGSEDTSRSHFEAQDFMEHGGRAAGGWLGRYLRQNHRAANNPLASVAFGTTCPESLRSSPATVVLNSLDDIGFNEAVLPFVEGLERTYGQSVLPWARHGGDMLRAVRRIVDLQASDATVATTSAYPQDSFGQHLRQVARLIKAGVGLEAATVDLGGWDSHIANGTLMTPLMKRLSTGLSAFRADLGPLMAHTTVVVMSEFGRRVYENASLGTDHGRGGLMMLLGGCVAGGRVLAGWPGLDAEHLEGPGDVPVTFNYRDLLAPVFQRHLPSVALHEIFPGYTLHPADIYLT